MADEVICDLCCEAPPCSCGQYGSGEKEHRVNKEMLEDVCLDCCDFIAPNGLCDCKKCGVNALKKLERNK